MPPIDKYLLLGYSGGHYMCTHDLYITENERGTYIHSEQLLFYMPDYISTISFISNN